MPHDILPQLAVNREASDCETQQVYWCKRSQDGGGRIETRPIASENRRTTFV
jgi:hypothetical protein